MDSLKDAFATAAKIVIPVSLAFGVAGWAALGENFLWATGGVAAVTGLFFAPSLLAAARLDIAEAIRDHKRPGCSP